MIVAAEILGTERIPYGTPFGFKGASNDGKTLARVAIESDAGLRVIGIGGFAPLWSDAGAHASLGREAAESLMRSILGFALDRIKGRNASDPPALWDGLFPEIADYARATSGLGELSPTFVWNALVAADNALWSLKAQAEGITDFSKLTGGILPSDLRQATVGVAPAVTYELPPAAIQSLSDAGHWIFKIKLGAPGGRRAMLEQDRSQLRHVTALLREVETPFTASGRPALWLDANQRYPDAEALLEVLDDLAAIGWLEDVVALEEPFPAGMSFDGRKFPVPLAADESLHAVADCHARQASGVRVVALKPAGKTLSLSLRMLRECRSLGLHTIVADSTCVPASAAWNLAVASRLPLLPKLRAAVYESNGPQFYADWESLLANAPWMRTQNASHQLQPSFFGRNPLLLPPGGR